MGPGFPTGSEWLDSVPMARARIPLLVVALLVAASLGHAMAQPAAAACAIPPSTPEALDRARVAFVGTVTGVADGGYTATFDVEEIWKGPNLADPSTVFGGSASVEDSRSWEAGQRYLVFPSVDSDGNLVDNGCSATTAYRPAFEALRPAGAHAPQGPPTSGLPGDPPFAAIFLVIVAFGTLGAYFVWRTGRMRE